MPKKTLQSFANFIWLCHSNPFAEEMMLLFASFCKILDVNETGELINSEISVTSILSCLTARYIHDFIAY